MALLRNAALLRDFLAVSRAGSLSAAANELVGDAAGADQEHPPPRAALRRRAVRAARARHGADTVRRDAARPREADRCAMPVRRRRNAGVCARRGRSDSRRGGALLGRDAAAGRHREFAEATSGAESGPRGWGQHRHPSAPVRRRSRYRRVRAARRADAAVRDRGPPVLRSPHAHHRGRRPPAARAPRRRRPRTSRPIRGRSTSTTGTSHRSSLRRCAITAARRRASWSNRRRSQP